MTVYAHVAQIDAAVGFPPFFDIQQYPRTMAAKKPAADRKAHRRCFFYYPLLPGFEVIALI